MDKNVKDSKTRLREKKLRKQKMKKFLKSSLAILMALMLVGLALAPVFSQTYIVEDYRTDGRILVSDQNISLTVSTSTAEPDADFHGFIDYMMETVGDSYYQDVNKQTLIEGAYKGIFNTLDPYSTYFTPKEYDNFNTSIEGEFSGIGASITEGKNGYVEVVAPIKGTPAEKAGLLPGDMIVEINGVDAAGFTTEKAVTLIRGEKGTHVILKIKRSGSSDLLIFDIIRDTIIIKSVNYEVLDGGIGYIELTEFSQKTNSEFDAAMAYMVNKNIKKLIVDVRNNPGGLLDTAVHVSDFFIPMGQDIVKIDYKGATDRTYKATSSKSPLDVVVLINGGSASASEIFAGSIQKTGNGTVIGENSFGKGTVQSLMPLTNGGAIKLTIAEYKLAGDYKVHGVGIKPDIEVNAPVRVTEEIRNNLAPLNLSAGNISLNVYAAQQRLSLLGYEVVADGLFGNATKEVIKAFQADQKIEQTGALNKLTMETLEKALTLSGVSGFDPQLEAAIQFFNK